jgi:hypothetical protein
LGTAGDNQSTISYSRCPAGKSLGLGDPSIPTSDKRMMELSAVHVHVLMLVPVQEAAVLTENDTLEQVTSSLSIPVCS